LSQPFQLDDAPGRRLLSGAFLALAVLLVGATAWLTLHLTKAALEDRLEQELVHTTALLGGGGFPLNDTALKQVSTFIQAQVVAVDADGRVVATSFDAEQRHRFDDARRAGTIPEVADAPRVTSAQLGGEGATVGVAPLAQTSGGVYVFYPEDVVAAQSRQAWLPVTAVAVFALLLAVGLGVASERAYQRSRNAALLRLLASVGHEVRNPLGAIRTLAQSLKRRLGDQADPSSLDLIATEAERLTLLVDSLRTVGLPVRTLRREIDPDEAVDAVLTLLAHQLLHRRIGVTRETHSEDARVLADPAQVRQVVLNLVLNAADAMPRGGALRVTSIMAEERWVLVIEDEGPGVEPAAQNKLFDAFFTTKHKGLGIGLTTCKRLVTAHGGQLALDPSYRNGARFVVTWPAATSERTPRS
jgi:signal transduction histidine kinase